MPLSTKLTWLLAASSLTTCYALLATTATFAQGTTPAFQITMGERGSEYYFEPKEITVPAGEVRLTFNNAGTRRHNWVAEALGQRTPDVDAGGSRELTFTFSTPGTYEFICDLPNHAARGMIGTLIVTAGTSGAAGTAPATQTTPPATPPTPAATPATPTTEALRPGSTPGGTSASSGGSGSSGSSSSTTRPQAGQPGQGSPGGAPLFISLALHIPAAITWLGVVLYQAIVGLVPYLTPSQRADLFQRPKWLVVASIPLFSITGIYQTIQNPFVTITDFATLEAFRASSTYGSALFWKHGFVLLSMALTLAVTFWFAPRLTRLTTVPVTRVAAATGIADGPTAATTSGLPALLALANVAACLALLTCVAVIVFQLH